jgi:hypothetical protein
LVTLQEEPPSNQYVVAEVVSVWPTLFPYWFAVKTGALGEPPSTTE